VKPYFFSTFESLFAEVKPTFIGELGTHNGESAVQFCKCALEQSKKEKIKYVGYDMFEDADLDPTFARKERNAKGAGLYNTAKRKLDSIKNYHAPRFSYKLHRGMTSATLKNTKFDFVYIDAGHSYDSVVHDWNKVKESKLIVFDDVKLKSVRQAIIDHVEPSHTVEYIEKSRNTRSLAIVRNY